jgi:hypothetical protein
MGAQTKSRKILPLLRLIVTTMKAKSMRQPTQRQPTPSNWNPGISSKHGYNTCAPTN